MNPGQIMSIIATALVCGGAFAQEGNVTVPPLYFREDWREIPAETPVTQAHVLNPDLRLTVHGAGAAMVKKSHHDQPLDDPYYIWSGQCEGMWVVTLEKEGHLADLTMGHIEWRTKNFDRILYIVLGLDDGTWLVTARGTGETPGWHEYSIDIATMGWRSLNIDTVNAGDPVESPDLSRVRAVGFTDLERGGQSAACSRLDWIEVYGRDVTSQ